MGGFYLYYSNINNHSSECWELMDLKFNTNILTHVKNIAKPLDRISSCPYWSTMTYMHTEEITYMHTYEIQNTSLALPGLFYNPLKFGVT